MPAVTLALGMLIATASTRAADAARGQRLAMICATCHVMPGYADVDRHPGVPLIAGMPQDPLLAALRAYRSGQRNNPQMMAQAAGLSEQDMHDLAAWLARSRSSPPGR